jgi:uncharacterized protein (DUF1800 family)
LFVFLANLSFFQKDYTIKITKVSNFDYFYLFLKIYSNPNIYNKLSMKPKPNQADPLFVKYAKKKPGRISNNLARVSPNTTDLSVYNGPWTAAEASHLLRRLSFGAKKPEIDNLVSQGMAAAIDGLLTYANTPLLPSPTPLNHYQAGFADPLVALGQSWTQANFNAYNGNEYHRKESMKRWSWGVILNDTTSAREKMADFWTHFIPIDYENVEATNSATMVHDYRTLIRENCLGNFKTMMKAIAKSPAMLIYLSGQSSTKNAPNENFARELMELFTLGKNANQALQTYTEADIQAAAKVFSGWRIANFLQPYPWVVAFNPTYHNQSDKVFSSHFASVGASSVTITNQTGASGANEFDIFFDLLFSNQSLTIAKYICRRLYRFFVYYEIDPSTEANVITPLADLFVESNWEFRPVVEKLFKSQHFYDSINRGVMIKSPIDLIAGLLRSLNINTNTASNTDYLNQYNVWDYFQSQAYNGMEQGIGLLPDVSGWKAYYQEPSYYQNWINSNTIQNREKFITAMINGTTRSTVLIKLDLIAYVNLWPLAVVENPNTLIDAIIQHLLPLDLPAVTKTDVLKVPNLLNNQTSDSYWTNAWNAYLAALAIVNPTPAQITDLTAKTKLVNDRLKALMSAILKLAEYQLM